MPERRNGEIVHPCRRDPRVISNNAVLPGQDVLRRIRSGLVLAMITGCIGLDLEAHEQMTAGQVAMELVLQRTLSFRSQAYRFRIAGPGAGGIGVSTIEARSDVYDLTGMTLFQGRMAKCATARGRHGERRERLAAE